MKSMIPTAEYSLTLLDELAEQGINAVVVEFEDKFPFDVTAGIHHPAAWTKEEFRAFAKTLQYCIGNPLYHWSHLELKRYFDIDEAVLVELPD